MTTENGPAPALSSTLERALRAASSWHRGQTRKGSGVPYIAHPMGVALILARLGFDDHVVAAGLLHDAVEDTGATLAEVREGFGAAVAEIVARCSEAKHDASGAKRPWSDRKRDYLEAVAAGPVEARAVALADKLHNLASIRLDLEEGRDVWSLFNADRRGVLEYYRSAVERFGRGEPRLESLVAGCLEELAAVEALASQNRPEGGLPG